MFTLTELSDRFQKICGTHKTHFVAVAPPTVPSRQNELLLLLLARIAALSSFETPPRTGANKKRAPAASAHMPNNNNNNNGHHDNDDDEDTTLAPPLATPLSGRAERPTKQASRLTFSFHFLNNVGAGFNLTVMGLTLESLGSMVSDTTGDKSMVAGAGFLGALCGQLIMGFLGDLLGRTAALVLTTVLIIGGAIASAALDTNSQFFVSLAVCRFITCLGVGGVYPLTATSSSEENSKVSPTLLVFAGQGFGQLLVPLLFLLLSDRASSVWRVILALGAFPSVLGLTLFAIHKFREQQEHRGDTEEKVTTTKTSFLAALCQYGAMKKLVGTGMTWFLFDVTFYSNVVFAQDVLASMLQVNESNITTNATIGSGGEITLQRLAGPSSLVLLVGLSGYWFSYMFIDRLGLRKLQMLGFVILTLLYSALAVTFEVLPTWVMFAMYSGTFFFSNFGPNSTTFCLPSKTFPVQVRSTFNGVSAGLGKLGAFVGIYFFPLVKEAYNVEVVLAFSAAVAFLGFLFTYFLVHPNDADVVDSAQRTLAYELVHAQQVHKPKLTSVSPREAAEAVDSSLSASSSSTEAVDNRKNPFLAILEKV